MDGWINGLSFCLSVCLSIFLSAQRSRTTKQLNINRDIKRKMREKSSSDVSYRSKLIVSQSVDRSISQSVSRSVSLHQQLTITRLSTDSTVSTDSIQSLIRSHTTLNPQPSTTAQYVIEHKDFPISPSVHQSHQSRHKRTPHSFSANGQHIPLDRRLELDTYSTHTVHKLILLLCPLLSQFLFFRPSTFRLKQQIFVAFFLSLNDSCD